MEFEFLRIIIKWVFDRKSRLVLLGYRPEVICLVQGTTIPNKYLFIRPRAQLNIWTLPQEGIELDESVESAVIRCLKNELGLDESKIQFRKSTWIGKRTLPIERWDEREHRYSIRGVLTKKKMIGKAYYAALVVADSRAKINPNPAEVDSWEWVQGENYLEKISTNSQEKKEILEKVWEQLMERWT